MSNTNQYTLPDVRNLSVISKQKVLVVAFEETDILYFEGDEDSSPFGRLLQEDKPDEVFDIGVLYVDRFYKNYAPSCLPPERFDSLCEQHRRVIKDDIKTMREKARRYYAEMLWLPRPLRKGKP